MITLNGTDHVYTPKYQDHVYFSEVNGKSNFLGFRYITNFLLSDAWKINIEDEAGDNIPANAKIIVSHQFEKFPSDEEIMNTEKGSEWLPKYLHPQMKFCEI